MPARHRLREAQERLGEHYIARILEPSPPAVTDPPYFAEDPVARETAGEDGRPVVSPVATGDLLWDDVLAGDRPDLRDFAADRWLGAYRRLAEPPEHLADTRDALHRL